ncbi:hypothetical protein HYS10_01480 [Candidatus Collierbacteria bacterium]|nr:hypothetical protein [Candidatus Collierbacteria bacterium]
MERVTDRDSSLAEAAQILLRRTKFRWNPKHGDHWGGHRPAEIMSLTATISRLIGITPDQAKNIEVIFADHQAVGTPFINRQATLAVCIARSHLLSSRIAKITVIINRSLEVVIEGKPENTPSWNRYESHPVIDTNQSQDPICCELISAWENIIATVGEELKHAQTYLLAGSFDKSNYWEDRYIKILLAKSAKVGGVYSADIHEIAASRVVCRILETLATHEERKKFFRSCYEQSLKERNYICFPTYDPLFYVHTRR